MTRDCNAIKIILTLDTRRKIKIIIEPRFRVRKAALNATIMLLHRFGARILRSKN